MLINEADLFSREPEGPFEKQRLVSDEHHPIPKMNESLIEIIQAMILITDLFQVCLYLLFIGYFVNLNLFYLCLQLGLNHWLFFVSQTSLLCEFVQVKIFGKI